MPSSSAAKDSLPAVLKRLNGVNHNKKIKLRFKPTKEKGYSLYLDLWHNGRRSYEFLELYVSGKAASAAQDRDALRLAVAMRDQKENELLKQRTGFELASYSDKANFITFFRQVAAEKQHQNWTSALKHLLDFSGERLTFRQIDRKFCEGFKEYLLSRLDRNTSNTYFSKLKTALNVAVRKEIIKDSPARLVTIRRRESTREFLTIDELKRAMETPTADREVRNAFVFSCFTGLRISDIRRLTLDRINGSYLDFRQQKTKGIERMKLPPNALGIIEEQRGRRQHSEDGLIFLLPIDPGTVNKVIRNWMAAAGVRKKITFHCARHTFATMCLTRDVDIYTVSKLLGHKDLQTTQIYAKLVDKKKDEAIDRLPVL